ncbi:PleD family two-component system response regulator [Patescibacteria group bacterium]
MADKKPLKVMVAEDDSFLMNMYLAKFKQEGYEVIASADGVEAITSLKAGENPDIILLDIMMPNKNGFEVLDFINTDPKLKKTPVIILSNLGQESDIQRGKDAGAVDFIVKANISLEDIVTKIKKYTA